MTSIIIAISLYCSTMTGHHIYSMKCIKKTRQCIRDKQVNPVGNDDAYLDECLYELWEKKK